MKPAGRPDWMRQRPTAEQPFLNQVNEVREHVLLAASLAEWVAQGGKPSTYALRVPRGNEQIARQEG
jgi:hypothetical protein